AGTAQLALIAATESPLSLNTTISSSLRSQVTAANGSLNLPKSVTGKFCSIRRPIGAFDSSEIGENDGRVRCRHRTACAIFSISPTLITAANAPPTSEPIDVPATTYIWV